MAKNREKAANNRAKKAKARTLDRQLKAARDAVTFRQKKATSLVSFLSNPTTGYEFWLLHGANYLLSSYEEGIWSPVFPEAYEKKTVSRAEFFRRITRSHLDPKTNRLTPSGTKAILWSSLKPKEMFALVVRARQFAWAAKKDPQGPAVPEVWSFLVEVLAKFSDTLDLKKKTDDGSFTLPSADEYGEFLPEAIAATIADLSGVPDPSETRAAKPLAE